MTIRKSTGQIMTEHDEVPSVDNDALASAEQQDPAGAPATPPQQAVGTARLQQLIRDKQAAEALAATSAAQAAALRERPQSPARPQDYRAPEQYTRAIAEQAVREVGAEILARQASQAQEAAARAAKDAWAEATAAFREKAPDFEAVAHNPDLAITPVMADAIRESSRGAEIAYYLGKNPAEAARIASLPPVSQATAIARLEARIEDPQASITKAPPPVSALSGRSGSGSKRLEDMSFEEYRHARGY
jgi:hypothetical protein